MVLEYMAANAIEILKATCHVFINSEVVFGLHKRNETQHLICRVVQYDVKNSAVQTILTNASQLTQSQLLFFKCKILQ